MMQKTLTNRARKAKYMELKQLSQKDLIDRIQNYPFQDFLNFDTNGMRRFPVGMIAYRVQNNDYQMSDKQHIVLMKTFTRITVPEVNVVSTMFYNNDPSTFAQEQIGESDQDQSLYGITYMLTPEPSNSSDKNAVRVSVKGVDNEDGTHIYHHIGYLPAEFVAMNHIWKEMEVQGGMIRSSNGDVSYQLPIDLEVLADINMEKMNNISLDGIVGNLMNMSKGLQANTASKTTTDVSLTDNDLANLQSEVEQQR